jgi:2-dehydropantoate 2-reductase
MKVCIFGAGAIGGFIAAMLARVGEEVSLIARGDHLEAMRARGLRIVGPNEEFTAHPVCTADPNDLGPQDAVMLTTKAYAVPDAAMAMAPLLGSETPVVIALNGIPWWYFHGLDGPWEGSRLKSVDPRGMAWDHIGPERVIGCVVSANCEVIEPGVIKMLTNRSLTLGEADGSSSQRCKRLAEVLESAGFDTPIVPRIRDEVWTKVSLNVSFSQIAVLTGSTLGQLLDGPTLNLARKIMVEAQAVAEALGAKFKSSIDQLVQVPPRFTVIRPPFWSILSWAVQWKLPPKSRQSSKWVGWLAWRRRP